MIEEGPQRADNKAKNKLLRVAAAALLEPLRAIKDGASVQRRQQADGRHTHKIKLLIQSEFKRWWSRRTLLDTQLWKTISISDCVNAPERK